MTSAQHTLQPAPLLPQREIRTVGLAGVGSVGTAWAALLLARGFDVLAFDTAAGAVERARAGVREVWPALHALGTATLAEPPLEKLREAASLEDMASRSDLVQENGAEAIAVKADMVARIDAALAPDRLILSSSGGIPPSKLQAFCAHPERLLIGHPFHPASVVPLVEVVPGAATSEAATALAASFYRSLGKYPITLRREMTGHLANRLQFALLREAIHCLHEGVASAEDIDAAMREGLGPRWAVMGPLMTFNLAGGEGGIEQVLQRFGPDIETWWASLGQPTLGAPVADSLRQGMAELSRGRRNGEWAAWRDRELVSLLAYRRDHPYAGDEPPPA